MSLTSKTDFDWIYYFVKVSSKRYSSVILLSIIRKLKSIKEILKSKYGVTKIGIFGSYARGENNENSDLDIITNFELRDYKLLYGMEKLIKETLNFENIDLVTFDGVSPFAAESINEDVIYI